jgi:hypothetical protein
MDPSDYVPIPFLRTEAEPISQRRGAAASQTPVKLLLGTVENGQMTKMLDGFDS